MFYGTLFFSFSALILFLASSKKGSAKDEV
jgi:hypothetical protein